MSKRSLDSITRKESADAITSPDQLDQLMVVTSRRGWLMLIVIGSILLVAIAWSIFGQISRDITGMGMLLPSEEPVLVQAKASGQLESLGFKHGDTVKKGDLLARINDAVAQRQLIDLQNEYKSLEKIHDDLQKREDAQIKLSKARLDKQLVSLNKSITDTQALIELQTKQLKDDQQLLESGLIQKQQLIQTQQTLTTMQNSKLESEAQVTVAKLTHDESIFSIKQSHDSRETLLLTKESSINELQTRIQEVHAIRSPVDGTIMETRFDLSNIVTLGNDVFEILPTSKGGNNCVAYVDASFGKRIKEGMVVLVSPTFARPEKYGYILGEVTEVGELIASKATIGMSYSNDLFVEEIIDVTRSPLKVSIDLKTDDSTPSGYKWTSQGSWPHQIHVGTVMSIKVEYETERPIELFLPWLKKTFLGIGKTNSTQ